MRDDLAAVLFDQAQAVLLHGGEVRAARDQRDVTSPRWEQLRAQVAADGAGAEDGDFHRGQERAGRRAAELGRAQVCCASAGTMLRPHPLSVKARNRGDTAPGSPRRALRPLRTLAFEPASWRATLDDPRSAYDVHRCAGRLSGHGRPMRARSSQRSANCRAAERNLTPM